MHWALYFSTGLLLSLLSSPVTANTNGLVVNQDTDCDFFMLKTSAGMTLLRSSGKVPPSSGTRMQSQQTLSERDFGILATANGDNYRVWVDLHNRSVASVVQEYHKQCGL